MTSSPADAGRLWAAGDLAKSRGRRNQGPRIVFGQVHEDAAVELAALQAQGLAQSVFCIGSGGCTALSLLIARPARLHVVDINAAQLHLIALKIAALRDLPYERMLHCHVRDAGPFYPTLRHSLSEPARNFWDRRQALLRTGFNRCGAVERCFALGSKWLLPLLVGPRCRRELFNSRDLERQARLFRECWDNPRWRLALKCATSRQLLGMMYGRAFLEALPDDFGELIRARIAETFQRFPAHDNPYLWQAFRGRYPRCRDGLPLYLQQRHHTAIRDGLDRVELRHSDAAAYLAAQPQGSIGFFALSNILEITTPAYVAELREAVLHAARPGALVCRRSILPPRQDTFAAHAKLAAEETLAASLAARDKSLFCRHITLHRVVK